jgi:general secretion pathway protein L
MKRLRIALPPLDQVRAESQVKFAWLERGVVVAEGQESLAQLGKRRQAVDCFLHPRDSLLTSLELPPLAAAKTQAAVAAGGTDARGPRPARKRWARAGGLGA